MKHNFVRVLFCLSILLPFSGTKAATLYSRATTSNWSASGTWSYTIGGPSCSCSPSASDSVYILAGYTVNMDKNLTTAANGIGGLLQIDGILTGANTYSLEVKAGGTLKVNCGGTLITKDLTFDNGSVVNVCSSGTINVNGNFQNKNNSNSVSINGTLSVAGSFSNGNGGVILGTGTISVTAGPVTNSGSVFGNSGNPCPTMPCNIVVNTLPIKLTNFTAEFQKPSVELNWSTATEINNSYFTVERSTDGINFKEILRVSGSGTTTEIRNYQAKDLQPMPGLNYYRLRQTDFDGASTVSETVAVRVTKDRPFSIYPSLQTEGQHGFYADIPVCEQGSVDVLDLTGRSVLHLEVRHTLHDDALTFVELPELNNGVYMVQFRSGQEKLTARMVVSH